MRTILVLLALLAPVAYATHLPDCEMTTTEAIFDTGETLGGRYYVDYKPDPHWSILTTTWVYEESNGIDGLQRRDEFVDDTCAHVELGDTIIY